MQFHRSQQHKVIAGVAGGIAESLDTRPIVVRIIWVIGGLLMPPMTAPLALLLYFVLAVSLPSAPKR